MGLKQKISQDVDDTLIFLDSKTDSLLNVMEKLNRFRQCSGLCINYDKSEIIILRGMLTVSNPLV